MAAITNKEEVTKPTKPSYEDLEGQLKTLNAELQIAKTANTEIQNVNDSLAKRVEAIELQSRTEKIANIISGAYDDNVDEKVTAFVKSGLSVDEITKIIAPLKSSKTKSAAVSYTSTVAIKNEEPVKKNETPAWAGHYLDMMNGGHS